MNRKKEYPIVSINISKSEGGREEEAIAINA